MPDQSETAPQTPSERGALRQWIAACLADELQPPACPLPDEAAAAEGILPWLAWRLHEAGVLDSLPADQQQRLRTGLRDWAMLHLACEAELHRLARAAAERGVCFVAFKGHSVARTLYPHPACRPTSDFDLLIAPGQLAPAQEWLAGLGYAPGKFAGTLWLGAQCWSFTVAGKTRFQADLHWDYSSRMYFRRRLSFAAIRAASQAVPCATATLRVPCRVDDLVIACVHLAAFDSGLRVRLIWLLDIYLLMAALDESERSLLLERAARARAVEACLAFGERAAELGDPARIEPVLQALRGLARPRRWRAYQRTLRWRGWDLLCYWARLDAGGKVRLFGDAARWLRVR